MNTLKPTGNKPQLIVYVAILLAIAALITSIRSKRHEPESGKDTQSALQRIRKEGVLRVGWGGFPPYTRMKPDETDPNKRVEGFMVDVVNEIAARDEPPLRVEWHLLQWETFRADLQSGKFDFIADPVFQTVGRAMDFQVSDPVSYFGIAVGLVRKDEKRFNTFQDIDRSDVTVALAEGYTSSEYARKHLTKANLKSIPVTTDAFVQLDDVLLGRSDIALNDVPTILQYVRAHPDKVKALWVESPPAMVAGGFLARKEDRDLIDFLNASFRVLQTDGTIKKLDANWKTLGMFPTQTLEPGEGLKQ